MITQKKFLEYLFYIFIILLPFQTRWMRVLGELNGGYWEYGTLSIYGTEIFLWIILILYGFQVLREKKLGLRRPKNFLHISLVIFIFLFLLINFLSIFWSFDRGISFQHFFWVIEAVALFFFILNFPVSFERTLWAFSISGVIQGFFALWQFSVQRVIASKWLGMATHSASEFLGESVVENSWGRFLRAYGTLPHPNILGGFFVLCAIFSMYLFLKSKKNSKSIFALFSFLFILLGLMLTFSRSAYLAFIVSAVWYLILEFIHSKKSDKIFAAAISSLAVILFLSLIYMEFMNSRASNIPRLERISLETRQKLFSEYTKIFSRRKILGVGGGNYTLAVWKELNAAKNSWEYEPVHSSHLLIAGELGLLGAILYFGIFALSFFHIWRRKAPVQTAILFALVFLGFFDHYFWSLAFGIFFFWLILAIGVFHTPEDLTTSQREL